MIMIDKRTIGIMIAVISVLLLSVSVAALPAPIGVLGTITDDGEPVPDVEVVLKAFSGTERVFLSDAVVTNEEGMFYGVVTIEETTPVDIQILVSSEESYVELVEGAIGWERYEVSLELSDTSLGMSAPLPKEPLPGIVEVSRDLDGFVDSDSVNESLVEKYALERVETPLPSSPIVEGPAFVPAPRRPRPQLIVEIAAIVLFSLFVFIIRHEAQRRR